jgi:hypothetical protein
MTPWILPTTVVQYAESGAENYDISWDSDTDFREIKTADQTYIRTINDLIHIARSPKLDITMKTWYLRCTGFNFVNLPDLIAGIEMRLVGNRRGRITDETIQLCLQGSGIGKNQGNMDLSPQKIYGGETDLWETQLTAMDLRDPTFGVLIRLQSHPHWPHKDSAFLSSVELRIH